MRPKRVSSRTPRWEDELFDYFGGIIRGEGGVLLEINGVPDHVHLLAEIPRTLAVADFLQKIKSSPSHRLGRDDDLSSGFAWQRGYGAFSVSQSNVVIVKRYISMQEEHHRKMTFQEEYRELLKMHNIECDERYVWD